MSPQTNAWRDLPKIYGPPPIETGTQPEAASVLFAQPWARLDFRFGLGGSPFRRGERPETSPAFFYYLRLN
jgi:hypothetical protein